MDINDYRRKIEASIAKAQAAPSRSLSRAKVKDPRATLSNKRTSAKSRAQALSLVMRDEGDDDTPKAALERLADPKESAVVRLEAIRLLQQKQFLSAAASEWRPAFVEALRAAVEDKAVRPAALEVLSLLNDRQTQSRLLEGLREPKRALVPMDQALRLLSHDVHSDVIDAARKLISQPEMRKNKAAALQATRILAGDPQSVSTLESVLGNGAYSVETRRVAATALSHLSPEKLDSYANVAAAPRAVRRTARKKKGGSGGKRKAAKKAAKKSAAAAQGALAKHIATLQRVRR